MPDYTVNWLKKTLFSTGPIGEIAPSTTWTSQRLQWVIENKVTARKFEPNRSHELLQGNGKVKGHLIGGCIEVFDWLRGTVLFPAVDDFCSAILFLETSEEMPLPSNILYTLRVFGAMGILERINGIVFGKPYNDKRLTSKPKFFPQSGQTGLVCLHR